MTELSLSAPEENLFGERYFPEINHLTFAKRAAADVFAEPYDHLVQAKEGLFIIVGTDSGLLLNFLRQKITEKNCHFVFIDFNEVLDSELIALAQDERWQGRFRVAGPGFNFNRLSHEYQGFIIRRKIHLIKSLAVMGAKPKTAYTDLWDKVEVGFVSYCRSEFNAQSAKVFEEQRLLNVAENLIPAMELGRPLEGREVVVLGGGPTLDDAIDWIRDHQEQLVIIAAARIAKRMEKEGILVDFFVTVDPFPWSFDNAKTVLTHSDYSILAHSFHAQHRLLSQWNGLNFYLGDKFGWQEASAKKNYDGPGPTVTNTALHLAVTLGASRVYLSGIDFCYAKGRTHESSSTEAKQGDTVAHHGKAVLEDNAGQMTETGDDFFSAKQAMENMIFMYTQQRSIEFISLGLHSAKMNRVAYHAPETLKLDLDLKAEVMESIRLSLTLSNAERHQQLTDTLASLKKQKKRFDKLANNAKEALGLIDKIYNKQDELVDRHALKVKKLQRKAVNLIGPDGDFITNYQAILFADSFKPIEDEAAMTPTEVKEQLRGFFKGIKSVSAAFGQLLDQAEERAQLRLEEVSPKSKPSELYERWQKWRETGRALQWQAWHDYPELAQDEQAILQQAIDEFQVEFDKTDHLYQKKLSQKLNNVSRILMRANNAFAQDNADEIEKIIEHVAQMESANESQKQDFILLLQGMVFELKDDQVAAFNHYEPIKLPALRHLALKKMLPIAMALEDYQTALIVVERLVQINLDYMVPYADLLGLLGNLAGKVEVLTMYLQQNPEKLAIHNKLAQTHLEMQQSDLALGVLQQVLVKDPDNSAALQLVEQIQATRQ